jgi:hypothetical protein
MAGRSQRLLCTADEMYWRAQAALATDFRPALPSVQAPTLFLYGQGVPGAAQIPHDAQQVRGFEADGAARRGLLVLRR